MSRFPRYLRRTGVVAAAALALGGLPLVPVALAAEGTVTNASPAFVPNTNGAATVTFTLSEPPTSPPELLNVTLTGPAGNTIADSGTPDVDGSTVTATFDLRGRAPGAYAVSVTDASGGTVDDFDCAACLRLLATPPSVSAVSPASRGASSANTTFSVTGANLFEGVAVRFLRAGSVDPTIAFPSTGSLSVASDNRTVSGQLAVATGAVPGARDVEVVNTDGQRAVCEGCFTVTPPPSFASLTPNTAGQGALGRTLTLLGADFHAAMGAAFFAPGSTTDNGGVTVTSLNVSDTGVASVVVNVANLTATTNVTRDLVLTNPDGGSTRVPNALVVTPEPAVTALVPAGLDGGARDEQVAVTGTGLAANPEFSFSGTGVTVNGYTPDAASAATKGVLDLTVAPGAATGGRTLTVVNPDGGRSTSGTVLTVGATPTVTGINPAALGRGASTRTVTITGTNFDNANSGTNVAVTIPGVTVVDAFATSATSITATVSVPGTADLGVRDVSVLNTAAGRRGRATCQSCFSVDSFAVDSVTPSAVLNSATYRIEVNGSGLPAGENVTATLTRTVARAGQDAIVFEGSVNGEGTVFTGTVDLRHMAPGAYTLRLSHGDASGTCTCTFSIVNETTPSVTAASPATLPQGAQRELTVRGTGFTRGTDVRFGNGVTKTGAVTFVDPTTLRVPVAVDPAANAAAVAITVAVPGFSADTEATCGACLTVSKRPTIEGLNKPTRGQGAPSTSVTVTGADFQPGATLTAGEGVTVSNVVRNTATSMTFTAAVADDAVPGTRTITVTNPDGGVGTCACFTVTPRPLTTSVTPPTGGLGKANVPVRVSGTGIQNGAMVSFGPDVVVTTITRNGDGLDVTLDLRNALLGAHPVTVTNPDGGWADCACEFTVHHVPTVTAVTPPSRGAGAVRQAVTLTGTHFTDAATVAFGDPGITVAESDVVDATRIDAVVSIASGVSPGARNVTVTNADTGQSVTCGGCFTVNAAPTVTAAEHTAQRNRENVTITLAGNGFTPGPVTADLGDGITVDAANAASATSVTVTFDVGPEAALGKRDVALVNPDGGRATCAGCLTVATPRVFTIAGDASPTSGEAQTVTVTAHVSSDEGSATDTSYTGVPVLFASGDEHFTPGTCAAAVAGVSTCQGVVFGDLGPALLSAMGTGADDDVAGTRTVTVEPVELVFSPEAPEAARLDTPVSFTVRPVAGVTGASIADYAAARTAHFTGHTETTRPLECGSAICTFSVTFTTTGEKTVGVSDDSTPSLSTDTATLTVRLPTEITGFRVSRNLVTAGQSVTMAGTLRDETGAPVPGATIRLYVTGGGFSSWVLWQRTTTDANGAFRKSATMTRTRTIKAVFLPPDATYDRADSSSLTVGVATRVTVTSPASGSRVAAGRTFTVRGATYPAKPGTTAYLFWRRSNGSVVLLRTARIASDGRFALSRSLRRGTYALQVGVPATSGNLSGRSAVFTLRVV